MTWDDVSTQLRDLVDAVPPVTPDEAVHGDARPVHERRPPRVLLAAAAFAMAVAVLVTGTWIAFRPSDHDTAPDVATEPSTTLPARPDTGPLAIVKPDYLMEALLGDAELHIDGECVTVGGPDGTLLVWPAGRATWVAETGTIVFENIDGSTIELHDGDRIALGGGGGTTNPSHRDLRWVAEPSPACPTEAWIVGGTIDLLP